MSLHKLNIRIKLLIIFVLLLFSQKAISQTDSVSISFQNQFRVNLAELNKLYCWSDFSFFPGKFNLNPNLQFQTEFENSKLNLFTDEMEQAAEFYAFLETLSLNDKQNFIRYFTFCESDFETALKSENLPLELKYLAPALSAMNAKYVSNEKSGVWQLTHFQAVLNGLQVNKLVDERLNVSLSTLAFARVMKQNLEIFKSQELAVLAYLYGNTKVKNILSDIGENVSLEAVLSQLPESANQTIAAFQATSAFLSRNKFKPTIEPFAKKQLPDTVKVFRQLHFQQVSAVLSISENELQYLNPQYKFSIVPGSLNSSKLVVPNGKRDDFVLWQDSIYNTFDLSLFEITVQKFEYPPAPNRQYLGEPVKDLTIEGKTKIQYKLKTGDVLGIIAEDYDVNVSDLKYWNNISNERRIQAGKKLDIFVDDDKADYYRNLEKPEKPENTAPAKIVEQFQQQSTLKIFEEINTGTKLEHIVKNGESPFTIAKKYDGVTPEDILKWNHINDARKIQIGQKLIVYLKR